jgi:thioredoxin 1
MNQKWLITIIIVVVLVGLLFWATDNEEGVIDGPDTILSDDDDSLGGGEGILPPEDTLPNPPVGPDGVTPNDGDSPNTGGEVSAPGSYEDYSPEKLARAEDGQAVLFFHAAWCPTCKTLEKDINTNSASIPDGLSILKVDYDNSSDLKKKYGVTYQHTMVQVDKDGNLIKRWSGSPTLATLVSEVQR